jgi:hypothetical protein
MKYIQLSTNFNSFTSPFFWSTKYPTAACETAGEPPYLYYIFKYKIT